MVAILESVGRGVAVLSQPYGGTDGDFEYPQRNTSSVKTFGYWNKEIIIVKLNTVEQTGFLTSNWIFIGNKWLCQTF